MSDKAMTHAIYLSNMSGVLEYIHNIDSSAVLAGSKEGGGVEVKDIEKSKKEDYYEIRLEREVKEMIEEKNEILQTSWSKKSSIL